MYPECSCWFGWEWLQLEVLDTCLLRPGSWRLCQVAILVWSWEYFKTALLTNYASELEVTLVKPAA